MVAYIKKNAPQAEIVVHQTWSYRADDPRLNGENQDWDVNQTTMYERLTANYTALAQKYNCRIIPVGQAVQFARAAWPDKTPLLSAEGRAKLVPPALPPQTSDVVGRDNWNEQQPEKLATDYIHLNNMGAYLQACVWYGFLFNEDPRTLNFAPEDIKAEFIPVLRAAAGRALQEFPQIEK